jgi:Fe-S-cluster containining protein
MDIEKQIDQIKDIYQAFETEAAKYKENAACDKGCAYCCTDAGSIDITTLEGLVILEKVRRLQRPLHVKVNKALASDLKKREKGQKSICPFLMKSKACMIYDMRPFSCRRIYSVHRCDAEHPPMLSRQVIEIAENTIRELQTLDRTGYSGHLSYIIHMLNAPKFLSTYLAGEHKPQEVQAFGKTHDIVINLNVIDSMNHKER